MSIYFVLTGGFALPSFHTDFSAPLQSQNVKVKENGLWAFSFVFILKSIISCGIDSVQSNGELCTKG